MRFLDGRRSKSRLVKISVFEAGRNEVSEATTGDSSMDQPKSGPSFSSNDTCRAAPSSSSMEAHEIARDIVRADRCAFPQEG